MSLRLEAVAVGLALAASAQGSSLSRFEYFRIQMGTRVRIVLYADSEGRAREAAAKAFERIDALERIMTDYDPSSELMRLSHDAGEAPRAVSQDLFAVLERAMEYSRLSGGAFDVTVGPLVELWRKARRSGRLPAPEALEAARARVGFRNLALDRTARTVDFAMAGMKLDLGGIGKGFAADQALAVLRSEGVSAALVAAGGDISLGEPPPSQPGWRIAIANPGLAAAAAPPDLVLSHCGVSTSGDAEQFVEIGGARYSHVVDPRTGLGVRDSASVTLIAPDATGSDALATALSVIEPSAGLKLADSLEGVAAFMVQRTAGGLRTYASRRMQNRLDQDGLNPHR